MSIASKLVDLNDTKLAIKDAIVDQGVDMTGVDFVDYPDKIAEIDGGDCFSCANTMDTWSPPVEWPDLEAIFNASTMPNKRYIVLFKPGIDAWSGFSAGGTTTAGSISYETSDGASYAASGITHNWNPAMDIDTGLGYKVRWLIVGTTSATNVSIGAVINSTYAQWMPIYVWTGTGTYSSMSFVSGVVANGNKNIQAVVMGGTSDYMNTATITGNFSGCVKLECVRWKTAATVTSFQMLFDGCVKLIEVTIPSTITSFSASGGYSQFGSCKKLKFNLPSGVTSLGTGTQSFHSDANYSCGDYVFPSGLVTLPTGAIFTNSRVKSISVTPAVCARSIHTNVLMEELIFQSGTYTGGIADSFTSSCYSLRELTIPEGITSIGNSSFNNCYNLTELNLPSTLTTISTSAFSNCFMLEEIIIPNGVTSIGNSAFSGTPAHRIDFPASLVTLSGVATVPEIYYAGNVNAGSASAHNNGTLTWIQFAQLDTSLTLNSADALPSDCLVALIASLKDNSGGGPVRTLTLGSTLLAKLTSAERAVGTAKNWTIV